MEPDIVSAVSILSVPIEVLGVILNLFPYTTLMHLRLVSKLWDQAISRIETNTRLNQEKLFAKFSEFLLVDPDNPDPHDWQKITTTRSELASYEICATLPSFKVDSRKLVASEMGAFFPSLMANVGVWSGCYYYEVNIHLADLAQIGWTTLDAFGATAWQEGIGDSICSWAYDGDRELIWNAKLVGLSQPFRHKWQDGDIIGCGINATTGKIDFWKNGIHLGTAWESVLAPDTHPPFFPAISVGCGSNELGSFSFNLHGPFAGLPQGYHSLCELIPSYIPIIIRSVRCPTAPHVDFEADERLPIELKNALEDLTNVQSFVKAYEILSNPDLDSQELDCLISRTAYELELDFEVATPLDERRSVIIDEIYDVMEQCVDGAVNAIVETYFLDQIPKTRGRSFYHVSHILMVTIVWNEVADDDLDQQQQIEEHEMFQASTSIISRSQSQQIPLLKKFIRAGLNETPVCLDILFLGVFLMPIKERVLSNAPIHPQDHLAMAHWYFCLMPDLEGLIPYDESSEAARKTMLEESYTLMFRKLRAYFVETFSEEEREFLLTIENESQLTEKWFPKLKEKMMPLLLFNWVSWILKETSREAVLETVFNFELETWLISNETPADCIKEIIVYCRPIFEHSLLPIFDEPKFGLEFLRGVFWPSK